MLCYVMLCYVMLCYVMLCYVMFYVMLYVICYMLCYVMLCYVMLCYVTLRYVTLRYVMFYYKLIIWFLNTLFCRHRFWKRRWWRINLWNSFWRYKAKKSIKKHREILPHPVTTDWRAPSIVDWWTLLCCVVYFLNVMDLNYTLYEATITQQDYYGPQSQYPIHAITHLLHWYLHISSNILAFRSSLHCYLLVEP